MALWHKKEPDLQVMYDRLKESPGISATELSRRLHVAPSTVQRRLPSLEEAGFLLSEDQAGRLWPYEDDQN